MSLRFCEALSIPVSDADMIFTAAMLHDCGKIHIPLDILTAQRALTDREQSVLRSHSSWGCDLVLEAGLSDDVALLVRGHHERIDGSGYPDRLFGDDVSVGMQVIGICDVVDSILHDNPYNLRSSTDACKDELRRCSDIFDCGLVECFIRYWNDIIDPNPKSFCLKGEDSCGENSAVDPLNPGTI